MPFAPPVTIAVRPSRLAMTPSLCFILRTLARAAGHAKGSGRPGITNAQDKLAIRELIDNWAVWRDSFQWDLFRTVWHREGRMWATWFQGTYEEFIAANRDGYKRGVRIYHFLDGS